MVPHWRVLAVVLVVGWSSKVAATPSVVTGPPSATGADATPPATASHPITAWVATGLGTAGIYRASGEVRTGLIEEIAHAVEPERLIFEAPRREQQVWLLRHFGTECNLGNIAPADALSLETLRLGLRSDTVERFALGGSD